MDEQRLVVLKALADLLRQHGCTVEYSEGYNYDSDWAPTEFRICLPGGEQTIGLDELGDYLEGATRANT